jgi:hypothetical protein
MMILRRANKGDLDFSIRIDLKMDGCSAESAAAAMDEQQVEAHRRKILSFLTDADRGAFFLEDRGQSEAAGLIIYAA